MTCDDYQIAFDQQRAGVTSAIPAAELDAHIAACAACTAYVSLSDKVTHSMTTTLSLSPAPLDADAILRHIADFRRRYSRSVWLFALLIGFVQLSYGMVVHGFLVQSVVTSLGAAAFGSIVAYCLLALVVRRRIAGLKALEHRSGDALVLGWRAELDGRIREQRRALWSLPLIVPCFHLLRLGMSLSPLPLAFEIGPLVILGSISFVRYRRLVRERALLGN